MSRPSQKTNQVSNLSQAASALGVTIELLRSAKSEGCLGFKANGRIDLEIVRAFLKKFKPKPQPPVLVEMAKAKLRKVAAEADSREILLQLKRSQYLPKEAVVNTIARVNKKAKAVFQKKLVEEWPAAVAGLSVVEARIVGKRFVDETLADLRALEEPWAV